MWSFSLNINPSPSKNREAAGHILHAASAVPDSKLTNVPQYLIAAVARNGISEAIADWRKDRLSPEHIPHTIHLSGQSKNQMGGGV